eukprot:7387356-Prymnesium_polylepis.2
MGKSESLKFKPAIRDRSKDSKSGQTAAPEYFRARSCVRSQNTYKQTEPPSASTAMDSYSCPRIEDREGCPQWGTAVRFGPFALGLSPCNY